MFIDEAELAIAQKEEEKKVRKLNIVAKEDIQNEMRELKMNLMICKISVGDLSKLFINYQPNDTITIFELSRTFKRSPIYHKGDTKKIARYLIEPKDKIEIEYNEMNEERIAVVLDHLASFVGNYTIYPEDEEKAIKDSLIIVIFTIVILI